MKNFIKKNLNKLYVYKYLAYKKHKNSVLKNPKLEADRVYSLVFNKKIDWDNPKNLLEKTYWLQLNTDTSLWTKYADKYLVRDFIKECGFEDNLPKLYGKWDNANDIDFDELPNRFVLKTNHSCGTVIIVNDKRKLNIKSVRKKLNRWLSIPFGYGGAQLHYTRIKPCIIAEELLYNKQEPDKLLIDYKIWCFHGEPEYVDVVYNRSFNKNEVGYMLTAYDLNWKNIINEIALPGNVHISNSSKELTKPNSFDNMLEIARKLSKGFPQVRVDFYEIDNKPCIGEMTFTAGYGEYKEEFYDYLGSKIDLNKVEKLEKR